MPNFAIKGYTFSIPAVYNEGHRLTVVEADVLNSLLKKRLRDAIVASRIKSRAEAEAWISSDEALGISEILEEVENLEEIL